MQRLSSLFSRKRSRFWIMILGVFIALFCFEEIVDDVFDDPREGDMGAQVFDQAISKVVYELRSPLLTQAMTDLTALGSVSVIAILFFILAAILASYKDFRGISYIVIVLAGAALCPFLLKSFFGRTRPDGIEALVTTSTLSFPSGHAFGATAMYIALAYYAGQYAKKWSQEVFFYCLGGVMIVLVGVSRIYLGAHYPTDVLGGISSGAAWSLLISAIYEWFSPKRPSPAT